MTAHPSTVVPALQKKVVEGSRNTSAIGKLTALTPVVDHVGIGPIEPVRMRTLHGDTLHSHSISVGAQAPVGIFASQVHASLYSRSARGCKRFASIQQLVETFTGSGTTTGRTKLDVASCLAAWTGVTGARACRGSFLSRILLKPSGFGRHVVSSCPKRNRVGPDGRRL